MPTGRPQSEDRMEEIPMNRYINPIPACCPKQAEPCRLRQEGIDHILAALACQNQILIDLLGAVNGLTAALLYSRNESQGPEL